VAEETFWQATWGWLKWLARKLLAPIVAVLIVAAAVVLVALGWKELRIGGLLAALLGRQEPGRKAIDVANTIPKDRIGPDGNVIPIGRPDSRGIKQVQVVPIEDPGLFSNPDTVVIKPPGGDKPIEIKLPDGVKAKDVDSVVVVNPEVTVVTVRDGSGVSAKDIDDLLAKYGSRQ
jgi:hypothetical protein